MIKTKSRYKWLQCSLLLSGLLLLVACSNDSANDPVETPQDNLLRLSSVTRAASQYTPDANSNIKMYVMTQNALYKEGNFTYGTSWTNNGVSVGEHADYYMYGYMPGTYGSSISAESSDLNGDYSRGCDLTITGLPMFTPKDICVIVGVQKISGTSDTKDIIEGNYYYHSGLNAENYVNLLMDHLYAELTLKFNVDADYFALRHIQLKSVVLTSSFGQYVNATVKLRSGSGLLANNVAYSMVGENPASYSHTFLTGGDVFLPSTSGAAHSVGSVNCPPNVFDAAGTYMTLTCTYDVCDPHDHTKVIRANCTASNKMRVSGMEHGKTNTVTVTIAPTYLYVLTDPDLDNPTIYIGG